MYILYIRIPSRSNLSFRLRDLAESSGMVQMFFYWYAQFTQAESSFEYLNLDSPQRNTQYFET